MNANLSSYVSTLSTRDIITLLRFKGVLNRCTVYDIWLILKMTIPSLHWAKQNQEVTLNAFYSDCLSSGHF